MVRRCLSGGWRMLLPEPVTEPFIEWDIGEDEEECDQQGDDISSRVGASPCTRHSTSEASPRLKNGSAGYADLYRTIRTNAAPTMTTRMANHTGRRSGAVSRCVDGSVLRI